MEHGKAAEFGAGVMRSFWERGWAIGTSGGAAFVTTKGDLVVAPGSTAKESLRTTPDGWFVHTKNGEVTPRAGRVAPGSSPMIAIVHKFLCLEARAW